MTNYRDECPDDPAFYETAAMTGRIDRDRQIAVEAIVQDLVLLCDTDPYALAERVTAEALIRALHHVAIGGAVADDQDPRWVALETKGRRCVVRHTHEANRVAVMHDVIRFTSDHSDNFND